MKTVNEYLDDLKDKLGSDYATAKALNIRSSTISNFRSRGQMSDETAIKIADLLGVEREEVLLAATIARSDGEVKQAWLNFSRNCGYSMTVIISVGIALLNSENNAIECVITHIMLKVIPKARVRA